MNAKWDSRKWATIIVPKEVKDAMKGIAEENGRSLRKETTIALKHHIRGQGND